MKYELFLVVSGLIRPPTTHLPTCPVFFVPLSITRTDTAPFAAAHNFISIFFTSAQQFLPPARGSEKNVQHIQNCIMQSCQAPLTFFLVA